jgi:hypothetical protein
MKSVLFDHKSQIYVNDQEGLKIDYKFNNINITEDEININLKDNFGKINVGSPNSTQRAILGDNFTNWLDEFLNILMGSKGGAFLGNLGAPVVATPALMAQIQLYFQLKDPKILSKNVYIVDNDSVTKQERTEGVTEGQKGDKWASTVEDNKLTTKEPVKFTPTDGASTTTFEKPPVDAATASTPADLKPEKVDEHPDVAVLLELLKMKKYKIYDKPYQLNIISIRNQCLVAGDKYSDEFVDKLYALYKDDKDTWQVKQYNFSTVPGVEFTVTENWISQKKFSTKDSNYWSKKVNQKITIKELARGPIYDNKTEETNKNVSSGTFSTGNTASVSGTFSNTTTSVTGTTASETTSVTGTASVPLEAPKTIKDITLFQTYIVKNYGMIIGNTGGNKDGIDGIFGPYTKAAWDKYGSEYTTKNKPV